MGVAGLQDHRSARLRRRIAAVLLSAVVVTLVVLLPRVASAAAPLCDPRGAVGFAPPPQLQDPEQSLDLGLDDASCGVFSATDRAITPDGGGFVWDASASPSAFLPAVDAFVPPAVHVCMPHGPALGEPRAAFTRGLDRPPRA